MQIAVVQLLDGRRLETLTPAQSQAEVAQGEHRADLGGQAETEVAIVHESESCRYVCSNTIAARKAPLILCIQGCGPVVGRSRRCAVGCLQVVVAVFGAGIQRVPVWQVEDAFQLSHYALLIALQLALAGQHGNGEPLSILVAILLALQEHVVVVLGRVVVVVGVLVPVHVKRDDISLSSLHSPLSS